MVFFNLNILYSLKTPEKLIDWCKEYRLLSLKYICPRCGENMLLVKRRGLSDKLSWRCSKGDHNIFRNIRKGTWFENSKLSLFHIINLTYFWALEFPKKAIISDMRISEHMINEWVKFCREICIEICLENNDILGGVNRIVEIDESEFQKSKFYKSRLVNGAWVVAGVERKSSNFFFKVMPEQNADNLLLIIREYIRPGTKIISKCWKTLDCLNKAEFKELVANDTYDFVEPHPNSIDGTWSNIKRQLNIGISENCHSYLFEYMLRRKVQYSYEEFFQKFIEGISDIFEPAEGD